MQIFRAPWSANFPDVIVDGELGAATGHPDYPAAKSGDLESALRLAQDVVSDKGINRLKEIVAGREAVLVPVFAIEASGDNQIPLAVASVLAKRLGIRSEETVVQATKVGRTGRGGWYRLANLPAFDGNIEEGSLAILVDDTLTQGGTFACLRGHIEAGGSQVIGAYALTGKQYSRQLRLSNETLAKVREKYPDLEQWWEDQIGFGFDLFTEWEARYLVNSGKSAEFIRDRIVAAQEEAISKTNV